MRFFLIPFLAAALFGQATTRQTIIPLQDGSDTGSTDYREKYANGTNYVGWKAPASITSSFRLTLPSTLPSVSGSCVTMDTSGVLSTTADCVTPISFTMTDTSWSQSISTNITTAGVHTITLTPAPLGVSAAITDSQYRITGAPGAAEIVTPTGVGTCNGTVQTSCTIQVTTANSHTTSPTIGTSTAGLQEAWNAGRKSIDCPDGIHTFYGTAKTGAQDTTLFGTANCIIAPGSSNLTLVHANSIYAISVRGIAFNASGISGGTSVKLGTSTITTGNSIFTDIRFTGGDFGIDARSGHETKVADCIFLQNGATGTSSAVRVGSVVHGDYFAGWFINNTFIGPWAHGIEDRGSGIIVQGNAFNGPVKHFEMENWTALVNTNGTAVTYVSGDRFNTAWTGTLLINGTAYTISSVTNDTTLVLASSAGIQASSQMRHATTGQVLISGNGHDGGTNTTNPISFEGVNPFYGVRIVNNRCSQWEFTGTTTCVLINMPLLTEVVISSNNFSNALDAGTHQGIRIVDAVDAVITGNELNNYDAPLYLGVGLFTVTGNYFKCNAAATTVGMAIAVATIHANGNLFQNCDTAIETTGASVGTISTNRFVSATTRYTLSATGTMILNDREPLAFAALPANASNGSLLYCSDCTTATNNVNTCAASGTGSNVTRANSVWKCVNSSDPPFAAQGGNSFGATFSIGTNDAQGFALQTNGTGRWQVGGTTGDFQAGSDGVYNIGLDGSNRPLALYTSGKIKSATRETNSNCSDSAGAAACGSASSGSVVIDAGATSVVVSTTSVTANSQIQVNFDSSLNTRLSVTCNTTAALPYVTARTAATSFTISVAVAPITNPACFSYTIVN